ncbi:hypothetical protein BX616_002072 [Lobosporangium transversale]|uniref:Uncharacterized protein n=1 Tax=Lobosporangium transversale TaxID=64571 RepID=A0A1Y2GEE8_9FUNG|nr:hypothetical protein BCR41DRAFT_389532 [Lobosporangium transversale]KAF9917050.1 hypothetical protein BX616_002072 [Lobosporangium transversale]ORZ05487.1 hypothetical protein BCR41DRAFT_389532 [Lobosporangium transversale]|eukprot:XP_021877061.1 hypothetical protein BCR41DRAFT_389532 [Lobosporangium transversale]
MTFGLFLLKKRYTPIVRYASTELLALNVYRVDVLGTFFALIRNIYSSHRNLATAHLILGKQIEKFGSPQEPVLYLDDLSPIERIKTLVHCEDGRAKAMSVAEKAIINLKGRVEGNQRVRKQHFMTIDKDLRKSFYWGLEERKDCINSILRWYLSDDKVQLRNVHEADFQLPLTVFVDHKQTPMPLNSALKDIEKGFDNGSASSVSPAHLLRDLPRLPFPMKAFSVNTPPFLTDILPRRMGAKA